jgi:hypothetical protein
LVDVYSTDRRASQWDRLPPAETPDCPPRVGSRKKCHRTCAAAATDAAFRQTIVSRLEQNRRTHPRFDSGGFCRHIEAAYTRMRDIRLCGGLPQSFSV